MNVLTAQRVKEIIDDAMDPIEAWYKGQRSLKALAILSAIATLRVVANIPDDIGGDED